MNGGSYRKKNEVVKGYFFRALGGLLHPKQFEGMQSEGRGYEIKREEGST